MKSTHREEMKVLGTRHLIQRPPDLNMNDRDPCDSEVSGYPEYGYRDSNVRCEHVENPMRRKR